MDGHGPDREDCLQGGSASSGDFAVCAADGTCASFGSPVLEVSLPAGDTRTESATLRVYSDDVVESEERFCLRAGLGTETIPALTPTNCKNGNLPGGWRSVTIQDRDRSTVRLILYEDGDDEKAGTVTVDEGASNHRICVHSTEFQRVPIGLSVTYEYSPADESLVSGLAEGNRHTSGLGSLQKLACRDVTFTHRRDDLRDREAVFRITDVTLDDDTEQPIPNIVIGDGLTVNIRNIDPSVRTAAIGEDPYEIELRFNEPVDSRHEG